MGDLCVCVCVCVRESDRRAYMCVCVRVCVLPLHDPLLLLCWQ